MLPFNSFIKELRYYVFLIIRLSEKIKSSMLLKIREARDLKTKQGRAVD